MIEVRRGICCLILGVFMSACATAPTRTENVVTAPMQIARDVGLFGSVSVRFDSDPTPEQILELTRSERDGLTRALRGPRQEAKWLGLSAGLGNIIVKLGQYAGGGGAALFGLDASSSDGAAAQNAGRNAAYAGSLAAGVTLLEQIFDLPEKRARERECKELSIREFELQSVIASWEYRRDDEVFRREFIQQHHTPYVKTVTDLIRKCRLRAAT